MKVLFFDWGAYTYKDIAFAMKKAGIEFKTVSYCFSDKNNDDFFEYRFKRELNDNSFDAVFSINFFPLVAKCAYEKNLPYISWSYDNPLNVIDIEKTLCYSTNRVFLFDRVQAKEYIEKGFDNIFHLPLAVNIDRLSHINVTRNDYLKYSSDISFVGKLYDSDYKFIYSIMTEYQRGYVESLVSAQQEIYGAYFFDHAISEKFLANISKQYQIVSHKSDAFVSKAAMTYALSAETTRRERLILLSMLSNHFRVDLYSREQNSMLSKVNFKGSCNYYSEMPKIFRLSKVNLNNTLKCLQTGIPLRALDIIGSGGFLLTNYQEEILDYFEDGKDIAVYENYGDAFEKASFYLKDDERREKMISSSIGKASRYFNYDERVKDLFSEIMR